MRKSLTWTKLFVLVFATMATVLALASNDQLVLLARVSFAGTAMIAPMVLAAVLWRRTLGIEIPWLSLGAIVLFLLANIGVLPRTFMGLRAELLLLIVNTVAVLTSLFVRLPFARRGIESA